MKEFIDGFIDGALPIAIFALLIISILGFLFLFIHIGHWLIGDGEILIGMICGAIFVCGLYNGTKRWLKTIPRSTNNKFLRELKEWIV